MLLRERKPNRLKGFDYSNGGFYFVTICTKNREKHFGEIKNGEMILNQNGEIVKKQWLWLKRQYLHVGLDEFAIMPNHFHAILKIRNDMYAVGTGRDLSLQKPLPELIGMFKTTSSKLIHQCGVNSFRWQRSYYDHIIRSEQTLFAIHQYIQDNPANWESDEENV